MIWNVTIHEPDKFPPFVDTPIYPNIHKYYRTQQKYATLTTTHSVSHPEPQNIFMRWKYVVIYVSLSKY